MEVKSLKIGRFTTDNNLFLAPLAGFTDRAFRQVCIELGAGVTFTEMVSAKGLKYNNQATRDLLKISTLEKIPAVQLFGSDPEIMRSACESYDLEKFDIVDINMGCPVPKVFNNGEGSALLNNLDLAEKIVSECVKSGKIITVKMRSGVEKGQNTAIELAKRVEDAGASLITVHGRCRDDYYSGEVDYNLIKTIKQNAKIPVIANGGVFTKKDADNLIEKTGADGIMLARGALFNPLLFSKILNINSEIDKKTVVFRHIDLLLQEIDEEFAVRYLRKQLAYYVAGLKNSKQAKLRIFSATKISEVKEILNELDFG